MPDHSPRPPELTGPGDAGRSTESENGHVAQAADRLRASVIDLLSGPGQSTHEPLAQRTMLAGGNTVDSILDPATGAVKRMSISNYPYAELREENGKLSILRADGRQRVFAGQGSMRIENGQVRLSIKNGDKTFEKSFGAEAANKGEIANFFFKLEQLPEAGISIEAINGGGIAFVKTNEATGDVTRVRVRSLHSFEFRQEGNNVILAISDQTPANLGPGKIIANGKSIEVALDSDKNGQHNGLDLVGFGSSDRGPDNFLRTAAPEYRKTESRKHFADWDQIAFDDPTGKESPQEKAERVERNAALKAELPDAMGTGPEAVVDWLRQFGKTEAGLTLSYAETREIANRLRDWATKNGYDPEYRVTDAKPLSSLPNNDRAYVETALQASIFKLNQFGFTLADDIPNSNSLSEIRKAYLSGRPSRGDQERLLSEELPNAIMRGDSAIREWLTNFSSLPSAEKDKHAETTGKLLSIYYKSRGAALDGELRHQLAEQIRDLHVPGDTPSSVADLLNFEPAPGNTRLAGLDALSDPARTADLARTEALLTALKTDDGIHALKDKTTDPHVRDLSARLDRMQLRPEERTWLDELCKSGAAKGMSFLVIANAAMGLLGMRRMQSWDGLNN